MSQPLERSQSRFRIYIGITLGSLAQFSRARLWHSSSPPQIRFPYLEWCSRLVSPITTIDVAFLIPGSLLPRLFVLPVVSCRTISVAVFGEVASLLGLLGRVEALSLLFFRFFDLRNWLARSNWLRFENPVEGRSSTCLPPPMVGGSLPRGFVPTLASRLTACCSPRIRVSSSLLLQVPVSFPPPPPRLLPPPVSESSLLIAPSSLLITASPLLPRL